MDVRIVQQGSGWIILAAASGVMLIGDFDSYNDAYNTCALMNWTVINTKDENNV